MERETLQIVLSSLIAVPLFVALVLIWSGSWRWKLPEVVVSRITAGVLWLSLAVAIVLAWGLREHEETSEFFRFDIISAVFTLVAAFVTALTASFTRRYLHNDPGFTRFHCFLLTLAGGSFLTFSVVENLAFIAGWECVGISSFLLVAYFYRRERPREHSLLVFACYRVGDAALMIACALVPLTSLGDAAMSGPMAALIMTTILIAAACKSAQMPFSFWLPRAMEGPTPSSAVFYGGVSVHLGCFLLLRTAPLWHDVVWAKSAIVGIGAVSFIHAWLGGRTANDVKTRIAQTTISHVGLVFIEIGLGWTTLALIHVAAHALVRTPQFLLASSALAEYLQERRVGLHSEGAKGGRHILPANLSWGLYRYGLSRGNLEAWSKVLFGGPFKWLAKVSSDCELFMERLISKGSR